MEEKRRNQNASGERIHRGSVQAVGAGAEEGEEAEVSEDLELLADFVADVSVLGMKLRELTDIV